MNETLATMHDAVPIGRDAAVLVDIDSVSSIQIWRALTNTRCRFEKSIPGCPDLWESIYTRSSLPQKSKSFLDRVSTGSGSDLVSDQDPITLTILDSDGLT